MPEDIHKRLERVGLVRQLVDLSLHAVGVVDLLAAKGDRKRVVFGTAADAFAAHNTIRCRNVDFSDIALALADGEYGFDTHRARFVASAAFRAGYRVLLELEERDLVGQSEDKAERTDVAEASALEEAADEHDHHDKSAESEAELEARERR